MVVVVVELVVELVANKVVIGVDGPAHSNSLGARVGLCENSDD